MKKALYTPNRLIWPIFFFLVFACSPREKIPHQFPDEDEMAQILADLYLAESIITQVKRDVSDQYPERNIPGYYHKILNQHNLTAEMFDSIRDWYSAHPYHYQKVYDKVIVRLSQREADLSRLIKANEEKDSLAAIRDLWVAEREMSVIPQDTANSRLPFHVKTDSIYGGLIRLSASYKFLKEDLSKQAKTTLIAQYADSTADTITIELAKTFKDNPITLQMDIDSILPVIEIYGYLFDHDTSSVSSVQFSDIRLDHLDKKNHQLNPEIKKLESPTKINELR